MASVSSTSSAQPRKPQRATGWESILRRASPPWGLACLAFAAYSVVSVMRFRRVESSSWDLGIFEQVVHHYAQLESPISNIKGVDFNILGDHFSPILVVLAPLYRVFPSALTLLVAQAALIALSVVPITRAAIRILGKSRGVAVGFAYGISWGIQSAVDFDFHEICFAVPILAFVLQQVLEKCWKSAALWSLPLVLVKEDLGLTVAAIGVCIFLFGGKVIGSSLAGFGVAAFLLVMFVLIPGVNEEGEYGYWEKLGEGSGLGAHSLSGLFLDGTSIKITTLFLLLGITGFVALRSPLSLLLVPTLGWRFISDESNYWGTGWHYNAVLMPILFAALVDGLRLMKESRRTWVQRYAANAVPAVLAISITLTGQFPFKALFDLETYRTTAKVRSAEKVIALVPEGVTVETSGGILSHLTGKSRVFWVGGTGKISPDFIVVDLAGWNPAPNGDFAGYARNAHPGSTYTVAYRDPNYVVLRRSASA
ncbi:DUF2079 domain-containing protein [Streptomyces sp. NPDC051020]|uniref:DUF2079 domain-containing protein n=1 Tax=Streptomyces sp. NPDC051020 TaxID=3155409 RepID=UPI00342580F2